MGELKPCPFCGGEARPFPSGKMDRPYVQCQGCSASTDNSVSELAIAAWNRRAAPDGEYVRGLEEVCRAALQFHSASRWTETERAIWAERTGEFEATTKVLCNTLRTALNARKGAG